MSPQCTVSDGSQAKVIVERYSDLTGKKRELTTRQVDTIVAVFNDGTEAAIVIEEWATDKDFLTAENCRAVYLGRIVKSSERVWRFAAGKKVAWLPKSLTTLFEDQLVSEVETPQCGLGDSVGGERA